MSKLRTHYDNLKVARDAPDAVIRAAYRALVQQYHPDRNQNDERAATVSQVINQSYGVLSDPQRRREHDEWIAREEERLKQQGAAQERATQPPPPSQTPSPPQPATTHRNLLPQWSNWLLLIGAGFLFYVFKQHNDYSPPPGPNPYATAAQAQSSPPQPPPTTPTPTYIRLATAPNGSPWPPSAGYVAGYPIENADGYSNVTVDNSQNDSDVFVKLVSLAGATAYPVRQFHIPARQQFTLNQVTAGKYDIRYRELNSGGLTRSESFDVAESLTDEGVEFSNFTMTLYKVASGNMQTYGLPEAEF